MNKSPYIPRPGTLLRKAFDYARHDMHENTTAEQMKWLEDHPLLWVRALDLWRKTHAHRQQQDYDQLSKHKPDPGTGPLVEYLEMRRKLAAANQYRKHAEMMIKVRLAELNARFGHEPLVNRMSVGDLVIHLNKIMAMNEQDDPDGIDRLCESLIASLTKEPTGEGKS